MIDTKYLYFINNGCYDHLPTWCNYYINLGNQAASFIGEDEHLVVAVSMPTRSYAAAFVGVGITATCIRSLTNSKTQSDYFDFLCSLPCGTKAICRIGEDKMREVVLTGTEGTGMNKLLCYEYKINSTTGKIPLKSAYKIGVLPNMIDGDPVQGRIKKLIRNPEFINSVVGNDVLWLLATNSCFDCLLVGNLSLLSWEIKDTAFAHIKEETISEGSLHDIIRVRRFSGRAEAYRSNIFPGNLRKSLQDPDTSIPKSVIFDGPSAFNNWHARWPKSIWIILLDRTDPNFDTAVSTLNQRYYKRIADITPEFTIGKPNALEIMAYTE